ncbi:hypothetical protein MN116_004281 [Schistosoma mekongi]|uniref:Uncharacterized protein n=1 Tax=Schistosoma mekongi TaxID=38744 RepID=A0AAE2D6B3_SCHME|nr:hypothetical protein MN116_004281 [Schistosoma mekongi]
MFYQRDNNRNTNSSNVASSIESIEHTQKNNKQNNTGKSVNGGGMTNHTKFDGFSTEYNNSSIHHNKWSSDYFSYNSNNKVNTSNRHTPNKYLINNQYYNNMEESNSSTSMSTNETKIHIFKSIDGDIGGGSTSTSSSNSSSTGQIGVISTNNINASTAVINNIDIDCFRYPLREALNQDLIDLLRSQISKLLEENEKLVSRIDDYQQKIAFIEREKREAAADPSNEMLTLQTELGEARLREAELTIAFEELQHRITAIDRLIETDPEMENFFNAVTISPTTLSMKKQSQQVNSSQNSSSAKCAKYQSPQCNLSDAEDQRIAHEIRSPSFLSDDNNNGNSQKTNSPSTNKSLYSRVSNNNNNSYSGRIYSRLQNENYPTNHFNSDTDSEFPRSTQRSGFDSPQSDSGCSLNSHTTSDGREGKEIPVPFSRATLGVENYDYLNNRINNGRRLTQPHYNFQPEVSNQTRSPSHRDRSRGGDEEEDFDTESKVNRPKGFVSLLRRSRSSAADHVAMNGFRSELISPCSNDAVTFNRASIDTPTPTEGGASESEHYDVAGNERKPGDRLSRLRASLRQSFGWPLSKPDFRMEAFAARQGEARALLKLRETRMDVLRVQSRCQTLQRHIDRLEAINSFRMSELEDAVANDRELRQEIRNLQTRVFQLEAEHREFKVSQRIKEMELMSKLAESNMRLSHAEMSNQQAIVWSQLNKAHEAAADLLTSTHSQSSLISPSMLTMDSPLASRYTIANSGNNSNSSSNNSNIGCKEDNLETCRNKSSFSSVSRYGDLRRDVSGRKSDLSKPSMFTEFSDGQHSVNYESITDRRVMRSESIASSQRNQKHSSSSRRDKSIDSLSDLRLLPEISTMGKSPEMNR